MPKHEFILPLITWFESNAADLPWRNTTNPYYIWLSEIMLQQTQVATVIPYYERFLKQFPTVADLAHTPQDDLLKAWEGLGYYSRARNLQAAAQQVMADYAGELPQTAEELQKLKGIGRYTGGAIASIAFGEAAPLVDGNVIRVFTRLFDVAEDVTQTATKNRLWDYAEELIVQVPAGKAGDYNQALMELGREVCKPRNPLCEICPVQEHCQSFANGVQAERPVKKKKAPTPHYDVTCGLIWNEAGQLLIARRPDDALLGGLWEFPGGKQESDESLPECIARELQEELSIEVEVGEFFMQVKHAYTHFKITLHAFNCRLKPSSPPPECHEHTAIQWVQIEQLEEFAFARADRKIIVELMKRPYKLF